MRIIPCVCPTYYDVDGTLIKWNPSPKEVEKHGIEFKNGNLSMIIVPHRVHIEQLKRSKIRGHTVIVWSAGGYQWAADVIKALKLEKYVDVVIEKPTFVWDDLQPEQFMHKSSYLEDKDE